MSPHFKTVPKLGRRSPGSGSVRKLPASALKVLFTEYQQLISLFTHMAWPLQQREARKFESNKPTHCFSIIGGNRKNMKPENIRLGAQKFPLVDYGYHAPMLNPSSAPCVKRSSSLRDISRDYFDAEANHEFTSEAAVFGTLIVMAIVPILAGMSAVVQLLRSLPLF